jgi:hypothetical protein
MTYKTDEYDSRRDAQNFWNNNRDVLISQFATDCAKQTVSRASQAASNAYGFNTKRDFDVLVQSDEKKHNENVKFREICAGLKTKLEALTPNQGLQLSDVQTEIDYFKAIPTIYTDPKRKADVRLRYAAYFNLCKIYYYLEDTVSANQYADLLIANEFDKKDGEKLKESAAELLEELRRTSINTRHFNPEMYFAE